MSQYTNQNFRDFEVNHPNLTSATDHRSTQMILKAGEQVRYSDLAKMSDHQLEQELAYLGNHCHDIQIEITRRRITLICERYIVQYPVPTWKIVEDYQLALDRLEAVVEEINYRIIP